MLPEPGLISSGFTFVPILLAALTVIVPLFELVSMSLTAVPLITERPAVRLACPAVSVLAPLKMMSLAAPVLVRVATPAPPAVTAEPIVSAPVDAVSTILPLAAVLTAPDVVRFPVLSYFY